MADSEYSDSFMPINKLCTPVHDIRDHRDCLGGLHGTAYQPSMERARTSREDEIFDSIEDINEEDASKKFRVMDNSWLRSTHMQYQG